MRCSVAKHKFLKMDHNMYSPIVNLLQIKYAKYVVLSPTNLSTKIIEWEGWLTSPCPFVQHYKEINAATLTLDELLGSFVIGLNSDTYLLTNDAQYGTHDTISFSTKHLQRNQWRATRLCVRSRIDFIVGLPHTKVASFQATTPLKQIGVVDVIVD